MGGRVDISPSKPVVQALSGFLRAHAGAWRLRRVDRFEPHDFHAAHHKVVLQGRIGPALVEHFQRTMSSTSFPEIADWRVEPGTTMRLIVPAISQPKGVLQHRFGAVDVAGVTLPMLTRMEGARLSAIYMLRVLQASAPAEYRAREQELVPMIRLLATLAHLNAAATGKRIADWANGGQILSDPDHPEFRKTLLAWVADEANSVIPKAGDEIRSRLEAKPAQTIKIPEDARPGELRPYRDISTLLLVSMRDLLTIIIDSTPEWRSDGRESESPRAELLKDGAAAAEAVHQVLTAGQSAFVRLVLGQEPGELSGAQEVASHLERWVAYVPLEVELGASFRIDFSQWLALSGEGMERRELFKAVGQTFQEYPLALRDAASVHAEVRLNDPALQLGRRRGVARSTRFFRIGEKKGRVRRVSSIAEQSSGEIELIRRRPSATVRLPLKEHFDQYNRVSEQELTLYAERGVGPAPRMSVVVPLRLTHWIFGAYAFAAIFFLASALFVAGAWWVAAERPGPLYHPEVVFGLSALGVTLSLWMTTGQQRRPLVHKKLLLAHGAFVAGMALLVVAPLVFCVWWLVRHN